MEGVYFYPEYTSQIEDYLNDMGYQVGSGEEEGEPVLYVASKKIYDDDTKTYIVNVGNVIVFNDEESFICCMTAEGFQKLELVESNEYFQDADIIRRLENIIETNKRIERKINDLYSSWMNSRGKIEK